MAKVTFKPADDYAKKLTALSNASIDISKKAVMAGAQPVADKIRANLKGVMSGNQTGALEKSLGIASPDIDGRGNVNTKIGFDGYDPITRAPNQLKARVLESGRSGQKKRPFVRPAVNATKEDAIKEMSRVIDEETKKIMDRSV